MIHKEIACFCDRLFLIIAGFAAAPGLLFRISAFTILCALGHSWPAAGFFGAYSFRIQLTVFWHINSPRGKYLFFESFYVKSMIKAAVY